MLEYDTSSKRVADGSRPLQASQINKLTAALVASNNVVAVSPQPDADATKLIKNLFENGIAHQRKNQLKDALKSVTLAIEMAQRKRAPYEAFPVQLQEMQFMLRNKIDLQLVQGRYLDALEDLDMLLNTGLVAPEVFIRKTDALLNLRRYHEARAACERGLALLPTDTKLKAAALQCNRLLAEYNGDV